MNKNVLLLLAITVSLLVSCTNEIEMIKDDFSSENTITFYLPGITTHQSKSINGSQVVHLHDFTICMFDKKTGLLEELFQTNDIVFDHQQEACMATIKPGRRKGSKMFYFAANSIDKSTEISQLKPGVTRISEMNYLATDKSANPNQTSLLLSGRAEIIDVNRDMPPVKVTLKHRVASFGLEDDPIFDEFKINSVQVKNATKQTHIFSDDTSMPTDIFDTENYNILNYMNKKVFYLYPGILGKDNTQLYFEGIYKGEKINYHLLFPSNIEIEADKTYFLKLNIQENQIVEAILRAEGRNNNHHSTIPLGITVIDYQVIETEVIL